MKRVLCLSPVILLAGILFAGEPDAPSGDVGERGALVVWIDDGKALGKLTTCRADAEAAATVLTEKGGYRTDRVILLADAAPEAGDANARRAEEEELARLKAPLSTLESGDDPAERYYALAKGIEDLEARRKELLKTHAEKSKEVTAMDDEIRKATEARSSLKLAAVQYLEDRIKKTDESRKALSAEYTPEQPEMEKLAAEKDTLQRRFDLLTAELSADEMKSLGYDPPRVPAGFRVKYGTAAEPYSNTGWAKEIVNKKTGMEMVFIPAGEFEMGSSDGESDEKPVHRVRIRRAFYLGKYEVTQGEWQQVMGSNPSYFKGDRNPVERVSRDDCQEFVRQAGDGLSLPTEAEWEYVCRAGTSTRYSFGDSDSGLGDYGWDTTTSGGKTHPVGQKRANGWGLHDMHGNVWEWCSDWYGSGYYGESPESDPRGPSTGSYRVLRGGSWFNNPLYCRSSFRHYYTPVIPRYFNGLRVARTLD